MLATPVASAASPANGPRPINLAKDTRQVLDLLDLTFGPLHGPRGQRVLSDRVNIAYASSFSMRLNMVARGFVSGFVWEERGKIIGNVSLLSSEVPRRFLIANVAVHPDYRRRGIAVALMQEALQHIHNQGGQSVMLQVESDNAAAITLYQGLGFTILGTMNRWETNASRLRVPAPAGNGLNQVRPIGRHDWRAAYELDKASVDLDLNWPAPPTPDYYQVGFWHKLFDFLNGRRFETWVSETTSIEDGQRQLTGLVTVSGEWGRPYWLRVRTDPSWRGKIEPFLLEKSLVRLKRLRVASIRANHPADDETLNQLLKEANFRIQRTLSFMRLSLNT